MKIQDIVKTVDHTLLKQCSTSADIINLCHEAVKYGAASVCVPPSHVKTAAEFLKGALPVCTVIGFPNGYSTTAVKCFEAADAIKNGAEEIDMVVNLGLVREDRFDAVLEEIKAVKAACGDKLLKVIIETCLLTEEEKIELCRVVSQSGAEFIKTSTGFGGGGATREDVALMRRECAAHVKVKASGGIASLEDAEDFIKLGAERLGTSRVIKSVIEKENGK
ncbi:MAG: deoxyribose-phosphate aldolase [Oscillospiraceae bacterium]|nr:deoxyribose-phosphate aldolase [Oscillospiraceae bacterium]